MRERVELLGQSDVSRYVRRPVALQHSLLRR